ncbi:hypothetical protein W97_02278 [Coniosporium apollinis CBS 100218]|uniref:Uncharacterized protein n=1 Tax=Coniosporium apollinis (strain CBS 100218) TaxID=1168221 RepID=R7YN42_CONA1|nr:uncharacterized protein W97_02278 [Coniosporium apollinis CBS 100218]EON63051.1 hypothetical protein W97_02278 [Coniosporium apollinis CBS 100218]
MTVPDMSSQHNLLDGSTESNRSADGHQSLIASDDQASNGGKQEFLVRARESSETSRKKGLVQLSGNPGWKPLTLKTPVLLGVILISVGLIGAIQYLVLRSEKNNGILFSEDVSSLPLSRSFGHLYLPTLIAVVYSFLWTWIDLDVKRLEPYYQLSQDGGASGSNSILLHYPFDFVASVPVQAIRRRHWPVFSASAAMVLVFWGVTPFQAGIFATDPVTRSFPVPMSRATRHLTLEQQETALTSTYVQSAFNIAWLNETLPPYMSRDYVLEPFGPLEANRIENSESWTAVTRLYSVDVACERAEETEGFYITGRGCEFFKADPPRGEGANSTLANEWSTLYVGYHNDNGFADYYLSQDCPLSMSHVFLVRWVHRDWNSSTTEGVGETALWCEPTYYQQEVNATVSPPLKSVQEITPLGPKLPVPEAIFNATEFEWAMSSQQQRRQNRGEFPTSAWPEARSRLQDMGVDLTYVPNMASFAVAAEKRPAADYLDPEVLRSSYQAAYRLLFSRQMVEVLGKEFDPATMSWGKRTYQMEAVHVVPAFAYVVEGLLAAVAFFAGLLLFLSITKPRKLNSNPGNVASLMSLVADSKPLLEEFRSLDKKSAKELEQELRDNTYSLSVSGEQDGAFRLKREDHSRSITQPASALQPRSTEQGVRPTEFRILSGLVFIALQLALLISFAVIYVKILRLNGLPLPSKNRFVRQLVENYIPTAIATFIEPIWVVLNRLLCVLQPFEELRKGKSRATKAITIDYTSLPPQLVFWRAFKSRHFVLGSVCCMALLANLLAVAFSGLFNEDTVSVPYAATFSVPFAPIMDSRMLNRTNTNNNRTFTDQFNVAMSNLTADTPMPVWTDDHRFYLPFNYTTETEGAWQHQVTTRTYGLSLECEPLVSIGENSISMSLSANALRASFNVSIASRDPLREPCNVNNLTMGFQGVANGLAALEITDFLCPEYIITGWLRANATRVEGRTNIGDDISNVTFHSLDYTFLGCQPRVNTGLRQVTVDNMGFVQQASQSEIPEDIEAFNAREKSDLAQQINGVLIFGSNVKVDFRRTWHNDTAASDFYNYLISKTVNSTHFLDPTNPLPTADEMAPLFEILYSKLAAIILGTNKGLLFPPAANTTVSGFTVKLETRIFMSLPMFIIAETILALYIITSICVYVGRPWRFLPRLPTTIASCIAFFAASHALVDMEGTAPMSVKERNAYVERMDHRYGFGPFVGTDGRAHTGIERQPFFAQLIRGGTGITQTTTAGSSEKGRKSGHWYSLAGWKEYKYGKVEGRGII